jgi:signal transduction histidine kinase
LEAIGTAGTIWVTLRQQLATASFLTDGDQAKHHGLTVIEVVDDGPGLSEKARRHLFDPFYSGREAGRGLGFGLCKCWRIITEHGGTVSVDDCLYDDTSGRLYSGSSDRLYDGISGRGTRFTITLPIDSLPPPTSGEPPENIS